MTVESWLAFVAASTVVLVIPGPTVCLVVSYALAEGRRSAWRTVPGVALGDGVAIVVSSFGLGTLLHASASLFAVVKLLGAGYLIWIGIRLWRSPIAAPSHLDPVEPAHQRKMTVNAFAVTVLNPESLAFFIAFLPQFIAPAAPAWRQFALLSFTFVILAAINATLYALLAGSLRPALDSERVRRLFNRIGGAILVGAGLLTAVARRPS